VPSHWAESPSAIALTAALTVLANPLWGLVAGSLLEAARAALATRLRRGAGTPFYS